MTKPRRLRRTQRTQPTEHERVDLEHLRTLRDSPTATAADLENLERLRIAEHQLLEAHGVPWTSTPTLAAVARAIGVIASHWDPEAVNFTVSEAIEAALSSIDSDALDAVGSEPLLGIRP